MTHVTSLGIPVWATDEYSLSQFKADLNHHIWCYSVTKLPFILKDHKSNFKFHLIRSYSGCYKHPLRYTWQAGAKISSPWNAYIWFPHPTPNTGPIYDCQMWLIVKFIILSLCPVTDFPVPLFPFNINSTERLHQKTQQLFCLDWLSWLRAVDQSTGARSPNK